MNVIDKARAWIAQDPDPETRHELEALIDKGDVEALEARFAGSLEFGTAGLRGLLGAGPTRMNRVTVMRTTAGLCAWLSKEISHVTERGICIGRDARLNSELFCRDAIEIATGAGIPVYTFTDVVPTPVLAFSVLETGAAGGVMVTASHNPPEYNGYKVYWENGAQIIPPNDAGIAAEIDRAAPANQLPRLSIEDARKRGLLRKVDHLRDEYIRRIATLVRAPEGRTAIRIAYTALHGVAEDTLREVFALAGFHDVQSVAEQAEPDGRFPTVMFPNPEEPGAMDRVLDLAEEINADLVIANDPDGDRVAVAVRHEGRFELLSGNDIGVLLADDLLRHRGEVDKPVVISTIVSSPMLGPIAASHDARWEQTLIGHKWIQNRALELEREGYDYIFGYEEALGYAPCSAVRDKDGISSALLMADMASRLATTSRTLIDAREALWRKHGLFIGRQISQRFEGPNAQVEMAAVIDRFRTDPPATLAEEPVIGILDFGRQVRWTPEGESPFTDFPQSEILVFELRGGHRAMLRPSGTEPKLKYYFYASAAFDASDDLEVAMQRASALVDRMSDDLTRGPNDC